MSSGLILGMSSCVHANTSKFCRRKVMRPSQTSVVRQVPIFRTFPFSTITSSSGSTSSPFASATVPIVKVVES
jgi:hypothetical protein